MSITCTNDVVIHSYYSTANSLTRTKLVTQQLWDIVRWMSGYVHVELPPGHPCWLVSLYQSLSPGHVLLTMLNTWKIADWTRYLHHVDFHKTLDTWGTAGALGGIRTTALVTQCYVATRQQQPVGWVCVTRSAKVLEAFVLFLQSEQFWNEKKYR